MQHGQLQVFRAEVVAPLRHAMRLVNREQRDPARGEQLEAARRGEALGCDIQQVELAGPQRLLHPACRRGILRRIEERGPHPRKLHRGDLVLHQRNQRRHDHAGAFAHERRHLVAQRLAAPRGHQHEGIPARHKVVDNLFLRAAKGRVAESLAQDRERRSAHPDNCSSRIRSASAENSRMFKARSAWPVSSVTTRSLPPASARQECPAASP